MLRGEKIQTVMRAEILSERATTIGGATEAPAKFQDIQVVVDDTTREVWINNPPRPGRGRPTPYVQGLEFIVRRLSNMLEAALSDVKTLARDVRRAKDDAADAARIANRENTRLEQENGALKKRIVDLEAQEAEHRRQMTVKGTELSERAGQVQHAQEQVRLREERHQEALDNLRKAHAEQLAALRAEQEQETDQLSDGHRQVVEAMSKDAEVTRNELQELRTTHQELQDREQGLRDTKDSLEVLAQQSYTLVKLIATVSVIVGPLRYVLFVDDADQVVEDPTYIVNNDGTIEIAHSKVLVHGQDLALEYAQGEPPVLTVASMESAAREIVEQQVPLDDEGQPTLAGLALLDWLQKAASNTGLTSDDLENCPLLVRLTFENNAAGPKALEQGEEQ